MKPLFENVDCVSFTVDSLEKGLAFYRNSLGLKLLWKKDKSCGLGMENDITEVVLVEADNPMVDIKVESVEDALIAFRDAGGTVLSGPFDIDIGKCAVVRDPFGNTYCILDQSSGTYDVDENGNAVGVSHKNA